MTVLEFEKPIVELRTKINELRSILSKDDQSIEGEIEQLEKKAKQLEVNTYANLSSWQKTQLARHPNRPYTLDFIEANVKDFVELHGDRSFNDDPSIVGGLGKMDSQPVMIIGHQKGRNTPDKVKRNFGMPNPEGYRKSIRLMKLANKFSIPILTIIDTPGAFPGIGAEERGQSEAIAQSLKVMASLNVPIISLVMGEGGSGGALALGVSNVILMLEHSIYSVISPEGCAGILWGDGSRAEEAAKSLRYTAKDLHNFGIVEEVIKEPIGGALFDDLRFLRELKNTIMKHFSGLLSLSSNDLANNRYEKFRKIGEFTTNG